MVVHFAFGQVQAPSEQVANGLFGGQDCKDLVMKDPEKSELKLVFDI